MEFLDTPNLDHNARRCVVNASKLAERSYCFGLMLEKAHAGKRRSMLKYMLKGLCAHRMSLFQLGVWKLFLRAVFRPDVCRDTGRAD